MTAFGNDRQERGRIAALEAELTRLQAALDVASTEINTLRNAGVNLLERAEAAERALADALAAKDTAEAQVAILAKAVQLQHDWHLNRGTEWVPIKEGEFIEIDMSMEYQDSSLCEVALKALASLPDSAAKLRAVGEAFSKARKAGVMP